MFRSSTDGGKTFENKINLSNTTNAESVDANIAAAGNNVYISWWERNATAYEPVIEVIHDNSKAFGQMIELSANK
jgi:hypothetical protein